MNRLLIILITLCCSILTINAQDLKSIQKEAREAYAIAMDKIKMQLEEPRIGSITTVKSPRNYAAVGLCETTTDYFCDYVATEEEEEFEDDKKLYPYFIRNKIERKESLIGNDYYEYLPRPYKGNLMFYFHKTFAYWCEMELIVETRYYYNADGKYVGGTVQAKDKETGKVVQIDELKPNAEEAEQAAAEARKLIQTANLILNKD